jgi:transposase-like protein
MAASILSAKHFHDEEAAFDFVQQRIWPDGKPVCPHCGVVDHAGKLKGKSTRIGTYKCYDCRKPFTVKIGTIFEDSHIPLRLWLQAIFLLCSSKKGISANQLHRTLGVTLKSAWFLAHRIREAMREQGFAPFGGDGGVVEVDETFIGIDKSNPKKPGARGHWHKYKVLSLVDRKSGRAHSMVVDSLRARDIVPILERLIHPDTNVMTDEAYHYQPLSRRFKRHDVVQHSSEEYARYEKGRVITTNTIEGFFSIFKRGMKGVYQHCSGRHLHRYLAEFDFRYNERTLKDTERAEIALRKVVGKRLHYRDSSRSARNKTA